MAWSKLPDFNLLKIKKPYITESITLPEFSRQEEFGLTIDGFIRIPTEGLYTFYLSSDDGSSLTIGDSIVIDNDGLHGEGDVAGDIALKAGYHPITVQMFQNEGDRALSLLIDGPGIVKRPVPADWLFHKGTK